MRQTFGQKKGSDPSLVPNIVIRKRGLVESDVDVLWCLAIPLDSEVRDSEDS